MFQGSTFGSVKSSCRPSILKARSGLSILPRFVPINLPLTVPSRFLVNSSSMSTSIVTILGLPIQRPASASATLGLTSTGGWGGSGVGLARR
jgi:hypothetical protein